jgi:hypothetical protein
LHKEGMMPKYGTHIEGELGLKKAADLSQTLKSG